MKKLFLFAMVAAALSGCSNSDDADIKSEVQPGGEGYVGFSIQLPTVPGTRANDVFDDGTPVPDEYTVYNATLFIFKGVSEASATFDSAYPMSINTFTADADSHDQCTTEGIVTSKITKPETSGVNLYAYVMINSNDMINLTAKTIGGENYDGITFTDFSKITLSSIGNLTNGMVMTNAPVANIQGGSTAPTGANITTLTKLDADKIHATQTAAEADPAGDVYVERAAAKVTVKTSGSMSGSISGSSATYTEASIRWALSNVNSKYYNTRQMSETWLELHAQGNGSNKDIEGSVPTATEYRFVSGQEIHTNVYRTYWGEDVNYTGNTDITSTPATIGNSSGESVYTFENTFDVDNQIVKNSTGIAISATFNDGNSFYTADTYGENNILQEPTYSGTGKIQDYIMTYLCNNYSAFNTWYAANSNNRITVIMDNTDPTQAKVDAVTTISGADALPATFDENKIKTKVNASIKFKYYADGVAYYNILIKHFGDSETPWKRDNHTENDVTGVYKKINGTTLTTNPSPNDNYLGRYGVLRNNWYQIEVTGIRQIGNPTVINPSDPGVGGGDPDDNVDNYLSVKIHITPWAVRTQKVEL